MKARRHDINATPGLFTLRGRTGSRGGRRTHERRHHVGNGSPAAPPPCLSATGAPGWPATTKRSDNVSARSSRSVAGRVAARMTKWLRRGKLLDERPEEERGTRPQSSRRSKRGCSSPSSAAHRRGAKGPWVAEQDGFNVHAGVVVQVGDCEGLCGWGCAMSADAITRFGATGAGPSSASLGRRAGRLGTARPACPPRSARPQTSWAR